MYHKQEENKQEAARSVKLIKNRTCSIYTVHHAGVGKKFRRVFRWSEFDRFAVCKGLEARRFFVGWRTQARLSAGLGAVTTSVPFRQIMDQHTRTIVYCTPSHISSSSTCIIIIISQSVRAAFTVVREIPAAWSQSINIPSMHRRQEEIYPTSYAINVLAVRKQDIYAFIHTRRPVTYRTENLYVRTGIPYSYTRYITRTVMSTEKARSV